MKDMDSEPHINSAKENLKQVLQNYRSLAESIDAFIKAWGEDENIRNRPERQKLCAELCQIAPKATEIGKIISKIESATGIEVLV